MVPAGCAARPGGRGLGSSGAATCWGPRGPRRSQLALTFLEPSSKPGGASSPHAALSFATSVAVYRAWESPWPFGVFGVSVVCPLQGRLGLARPWWLRVCSPAATEARATQQSSRAQTRSRCRQQGLSEPRALPPPFHQCRHWEVLWGTTRGEGSLSRD